MPAMTKYKHTHRRLVLAGLGMISMLAFGSAQAAPQQSFATPEQAVDALIAANKNDDMAALLRILGPQSKRIISSGDAEADKAGREKFSEAFAQFHRWEHDGDAKDILIVGSHEWPMPIPLIRERSRWHFDTAAGLEEIIDRRIGRNELSVIEVCRAFVEAQRDYAMKHRGDGGRMLYAQRIFSTPGEHNGLYWPAKPGEDESPLGPLIAEAQAGNDVQAKPYHGYFYRVLPMRTDSRLPAEDGFALMAFPAKYGDSGVMTFMVNQDGIVYEKDLGPHTAKRAAQITHYAVDNSWKLP
jgi:hypothetical protein